MTEKIENIKIISKGVWDTEILDKNGEDLCKRFNISKLEIKMNPNESPYAKAILYVDDVELDITIPEVEIKKNKTVEV